ncbi:TPA: hypothetical protein ACHK4R_004808, partial [Escherichia coli]
LRCCRQSSRQALPSSSLRAGAAGVPPSSNHSGQKPITGDQNDRERRNRSPQTQRPNVVSEWSRKRKGDGANLSTYAMLLQI